MSVHEKIAAYNTMPKHEVVIESLEETVLIYELRMGEIRQAQLQYEDDIALSAALIARMAHDREDKKLFASGNDVLKLPKNVFNEFSVKCAKVSGANVVDTDDDPKN